MIGNDVVDFSINEKKHQNQRYIKRILSEIELIYLARSADKESMLWLMWAAKEAAYKAFQRTDLTCLFSPSLFSMTATSLENLLNHDRNQPFIGQISYLAHRLYFQLHFVQTHVVHCVAATDQAYLKQVQLLIDYDEQANDYRSQSLAVRKVAQKLLFQNGIKGEIIRPEINLDGRKKPGPPVLIDPDSTKPLQTIISLSHDHQWLAVALLLAEDY